MDDIEIIKQYELCRNMASRHGMTVSVSGDKIAVFKADTLVASVGSLAECIGFINGYLTIR